MSDPDPQATAAWGECVEDLRAVIASQRDTIARLQRQRDEDAVTIARLEAALRGTPDTAP